MAYAEDKFRIEVLRIRESVMRFYFINLDDFKRESKGTYIVTLNQDISLQYSLRAGVLYAISKSRKLRVEQCFDAYCRGSVRKGECSEKACNEMSRKDSIKQNFNLLLPENLENANLKQLHRRSVKKVASQLILNKSDSDSSPNSPSSVDTAFSKSGDELIANLNEDIFATRSGKAKIRNVEDLDEQVPPKKKQKRAARTSHDAANTGFAPNVSTCSFIKTANHSTAVTIQPEMISMPGSSAISILTSDATSPATVSAPRPRESQKTSPGTKLVQTVKKLPDNYSKTPTILQKGVRVKSKRTPKTGMTAPEGFIYDDGMGYLLPKDFKVTGKRRPNSDVYKFLQEMINEANERPTTGRLIKLPNVCIKPEEWKNLLNFILEKNSITPFLKRTINGKSIWFGVNEIDQIVYMNQDPKSVSTRNLRRLCVTAGCCIVCGNPQYFKTENGHQYNPFFPYCISCTNEFNLKINRDKTKAKNHN